MPYAIKEFFHKNVIIWCGMYVLSASKESLWCTILLHLSFRNKTDMITQNIFEFW